MTTVWDRLSVALEALQNGEPLNVVFDYLAKDPEYSVGFTIAVIGLGAKMAKADGLVTPDEVSAFREVFTIAPKDEAQAAKVFNLARQDVAGFSVYAERIARMFERRPEVLHDLMEGLFHIALANGEYHPDEDSFLEAVAEIFGLSKQEFNRIRDRFVEGYSADPYDVLGVAPGTSMADIRFAWRQLVKNNHPDRLIARGVPEEAQKLASLRLQDINRAWEQINQTI